MTISGALLSRRRAPGVVHGIAAALLLIAAMLKAYQAATSAPNPALRPLLFDLALVEFEFLLAGLLLLNVWPIVTWGLVLTTFTIFAGVSLNKALAGATSCGCFGLAAIDPKVMTGIDSLMVLSLFLAGPRRQSASPRPSVYRAGIITIAAMMVLAAGAVAFAAMPRRGLVAHADRYDFGHLTTEQAKRCEHTFIVRNTSSQTLHITGKNSSCGCMVIDGPSTPIPAGGSAEVRVRADWSGVVGTTYAQVTLHTSNRWTPRILLTISGDVRAPD